MKRTQGVVPYRRKREGKTNYPKRRALIASGKPRLVVRVTSTRIICQLISYVPDGDKVLVAMDSSKESKSRSNKSIPKAYATGKKLAEKAIKAGIKEAVLDIGFHTSLSGSRIYAALKGAVDGGLNIPHDPSIYPSEERLAGKHIGAKQ